MPFDRARPLAEKNSASPLLTYTYGVNVRIIIGRKEAPGAVTSSPRSETHSGAVTPECGLSCHSTTAPPQRKGDVVDMRELKALEIAARSKIVFDNGLWFVPSQSSPGTSYQVTLGDPPSCTCEDFQLRQKDCKHVLACRIVMARDGKGTAPVIVTDAVPKRPTYKQNWPAYSRAQAIEKRRVRVLLQDLTRNLPDRERLAGLSGPKPHVVRDMVFAMAYKVYCGLSSRRFSTDLQEAYERGFTTRPIPGAKVTAFFEDPYFTPILKELIGHSARPLRPVETAFAIDSSGFGSSVYESFFDHKYQTTRHKCVWVKVHVATGVKTNIVTAVRILDKDAGDCPQFVPLVKETKRHFEISEVSADKAYASLENFEEIAACGGQAFIAFKSNTTGAVGGQFEKAFHFFQFKRDEYLLHYHKRSNVESTFSAIKRKFGHSVASKTDAAMVNEVLCKILCHNLTCLIQEQETLGIVPVFWPEEPAEETAEPVILPLVAAQ
jgi:transposase